MINVKELDTTMKTISGLPIASTADKMLTYRSALVTACETFRPSSNGQGEMLKAFDIGIKIMNAKETLDLSKEDVEFLKKVIEGNNAFVAVVVGRLLEFINK